MENGKELKYLAVDVTTLLKWSRPPVGIVRTLLEFCRYNLEKCPSTVFFCFSECRSQMREVSAEELSQHMDRLLNFSFAVSKKTETALPLKKESLVSAGIRYLKTHGFRAFLKKLAKKYLPAGTQAVLRKYYYGMQSTVSQQEQMLGFGEKTAADSLNPAFLNKNAVVVSIGLDWDNSNYPLLYWLKKRLGFSFGGCFYDGIAVNSPQLVMSYGFSQMFFKHLYYLIYLSDKIFCISDCSKNELEQICEKHGIDRLPQLKSVKLGDTLGKETDIEKLSFAPRGHKKDYVIYVSTIEVRKNHKLLFNIWNRMISDSSFDVPDLVCVGMHGWGVDDTMKLYTGNKTLQKHVHLYHDVSDEELAFLYSGCRFTVFPSYAEGWGLGAIESLRYGKPCVIADGCALRESTQGIMPCLNPDDEDGWIEIIKKLSRDDAFLAELTDRIKDFRFKTWENFSGELYGFYMGEQ